MATNAAKKEKKEVLTDKDNIDSPPLSSALVRDVRDSMEKRDENYR